MIDFHVTIIHGLRIRVSPEGWRVSRKGAELATGPETGKAGLALAFSAAEKAPKGEVR